MACASSVRASSPRVLMPLSSPSVNLGKTYGTQLQACLPPCRWEPELASSENNTFPVQPAVGFACVGWSLHVQGRTGSVLKARVQSETDLQTCAAGPG
jgi:hypothetical protein